MIIGIPKRTLLALPRVVRRSASEPLAHRKPRLGLFSAFALMMERQAELIVRGLGE